MSSFGKVCNLTPVPWPCSRATTVIRSSQGHPTVGVAVVGLTNNVRSHPRVEVALFAPKSPWSIEFLM